MQLLRKKISAVLQHVRLIAWLMKKTSRKHYDFKDTRKNNLHKILIEHTNLNPIQRKLDYLKNLKISHIFRSKVSSKSL